MRIHPVVNISQVVWYKKHVEEQKIEKVKLVEVDKVEEWKVKKILNKKNKGSHEVLGVIKKIHSGA